MSHTKKQKTTHSVGKSSTVVSDRMDFNLQDEPMITIPTSFYSGGCKLDASFKFPNTCKEDGEVKDKTKPVFVVCSGFTGLNSIHPSRYARFFTRLGNLSHLSISSFLLSAYLPHLPI